jgi:hypothetical protein
MMAVRALLYFTSVRRQSAKPQSILSACFSELIGYVRPDVLAYTKNLQRHECLFVGLGLFLRQSKMGALFLASGTR